MTRKEKRKRQSEIGAELLIARPPQVPWKRLEERYGLGRARLVELRRKAAIRHGCGSELACANSDR